MDGLLTLPESPPLERMEGVETVEEELLELLEEDEESCLLAKKIISSLVKPLEKQHDNCLFSQDLQDLNLTSF